MFGKKKSAARDAPEDKVLAGLSVLYDFLADRAATTPWLHRGRGSKKRASNIAKRVLDGTFVGGLERGDLDLDEDVRAAAEAVALVRRARAGLSPVRRRRDDARGSPGAVPADGRDAGRRARYYSRRPESGSLRRSSARARR